MTPQYHTAPRPDTSISEPSPRLAQRDPEGVEFSAECVPAVSSSTTRRPSSKTICRPRMPCIDQQRSAHCGKLTRKGMTIVAPMDPENLQFPRDHGTHKTPKLRWRKTTVSFQQPLHGRLIARAPLKRSANLKPDGIRLYDAPHKIAVDMLMGAKC
jgi:hypothetical protein